MSHHPQPKDVGPSVNEKNWQVVFCPLSCVGRDDAYIVGARFDRLNMKETLKAGNFPEGIIFMHVVTKVMLIAIQLPKADKLMFKTINYDKSWS